MANKRQRKKILKKLAQIMIVKHTPIVRFTFREIEDIRVKEQTDLHMAKENEKLQRTALYQQQLDTLYGGTVTPIEKYLNPHSSLLHCCSECYKEFYAKPLWMVNQVQPHECFSNQKAMKKPKPYKARKKLTDTDKKEMITLFEQGLSMTKIANRVGVSRSTVINHLRKAGLKQ